MATIVAGKIDEGTVVDDAAGIAFADHSRLHTVVKHFARSAAQRLEKPQHGSARQSADPGGRRSVPR
ncbi:hypothetical protein X737_30535 [Mesorhizobium sp. L48C026A00]|nr:hypothetical protein X737_30535 [Mesorhizobium sp. L48C026A00]